MAAAEVDAAAASSRRRESGGGLGLVAERAGVVGGRARRGGFRRTVVEVGDIDFFPSEAFRKPAGMECVDLGDELHLCDT